MSRIPLCGGQRDSPFCLLPSSFRLVKHERHCAADAPGCSLGGWRGGAFTTRGLGVSSCRICQRFMPLFSACSGARRVSCSCWIPTGCYSGMRWRAAATPQRRLPAPLCIKRTSMDVRCSSVTAGLPLAWLPLPVLYHMSSAFKRYSPLRLAAPLNAGALARRQPVCVAYLLVCSPRQAGGKNATQRWHLASVAATVPYRFLARCRLRERAWWHYPAKICACYRSVGRRSSRYLRAALTRRKTDATGAWCVVWWFWRATLVGEQSVLAVAAFGEPSCISGFSRPT